MVSVYIQNGIGVIVIQVLEDCLQVTGRGFIERLRVASDFGVAPRLVIVSVAGVVCVPGTPIWAIRN